MRITAQTKTIRELYEKSDIKDYVKTHNEERLGKEIVELLKDKKPHVFTIIDDNYTENDSHRDEISVSIIADVRDLTFCIDCIHCTFDIKGEKLIRVCTLNDKEVLPYDFCSFGPKNPLILKRY